MRQPAEVIAEVFGDEEVMMYDDARNNADKIIEALKAEGWAIVPANQTDYGSW